MNPNEFLSKIKQIEWDYGHDVEVMHSRMDEAMEELLFELGYGEAIEYIRRIERWYA